MVRISVWWLAAMVAAAFVLGAVMVAVMEPPTHMPAAPGPMPTRAGELEPCPTEDSTNCYWDATTQGNGAGTSFEAPPE